MSNVAAGLLITTFGLCMAGIFASAFRDNWGQFGGLAALALWSGSEVTAVLAAEAVPLRALLLYAGLAMLLLGTAWKVTHHTTAARSRPVDVAQARGRP